MEENFKFNSPYLKQILDSKKHLLETSFEEIQKISEDIIELERLLKLNATTISFSKFYFQELINGEIFEIGLSWGGTDFRIKYLERNIRYKSDVFSVIKNFGETKMGVRKRMAIFLPDFFEEIIKQIEK